MAIAFYLEFPDMSTEQAEAVLKGLDLNARAPEGQIFHSEGPLPNGGTWVMDGWESPEQVQAFVGEKLAPLMQSLGVTPPQPTLLPMRVMFTHEGLRHIDQAG
jgi:hypothetical protein